MGAAWVSLRFPVMGERYHQAGRRRIREPGRRPGDDGSPCTTTPMAPSEARTPMPDTQSRVATRHHLHEDQIAAICRVWGKLGEALLDELDECPKTIELRTFAAELRRAGGDE